MLVQRELGDVLQKGPLRRYVAWMLLDDRGEQVDVLREAGRGHLFGLHGLPPVSQQLGGALEDGRVAPIARRIARVEVGSAVLFEAGDELGATPGLLQVGQPQVQDQTAPQKGVGQMESAMHLRKGEINLWVSDLGRAADFYLEAFGFKRVFT